MNAMKQIVGLLLPLCLCVSLAACGDGSISSPSASASDTSAVSEDTAGSTASSDDVVDAASDLLDDMGIQMLLTSEYDTPQEIDLYAMFYNGALDEGYETDQGVSLDRGTDISEEERALLVDAGYQEDLDLTRVRREDMDGILRFRTGYGLDEVEGVGLDEMVFLEEYDAYYYCHSDTDLLSDLALVDRRVNEDGSVTYCYTSLEHDGELTLDAETNYVLSNHYTADHLA